MLLLLATPFWAHAGEGRAEPAAAERSYAWATPSIDGERWGIARGDLDGDGSQEWLLLTRTAVLIGTLTPKGFAQRAACGWKGIAQGAALFAHDLTGDGRDEIIVSAVKEGTAASLVLQYNDKKCTQLVADAPWSLRVMELPGEAGGPPRNALVGQGWSRGAFFSGPFFELALDGKKLKQVGRVPMPRYTDLFEVTTLPPADGTEELVRQCGHARLEVRARRGKKFRRLWRSGERYGGSVNYLPADQRRALDRESQAYVLFDEPPVVDRQAKGFELVAVQHDMTLGGFVGRRPSVRGARFVGFRPDPVLTFTEAWRSVRLPGAVTDFLLVEEGERRELIVLMLEDPGFWERGSSSRIIVFDLARQKVEKAAKGERQSASAGAEG